jgi:hypothetical protein
VRVLDLPGLEYTFAETQAHTEVVLGNVPDRSELAQACQGIEWVVHRAAIVLPLSEENHDLAHSANNIEDT